MDCSTQGFPVHHQLLEPTHTHVHRIGDAIQPSHALSSPFSSHLQSFPALTVTVSIVSPSICHEVMGPDAMILVFWMLSFKRTLSLSSFTFIKGLFSSSSLSAIRVVSSAYLRLSIFFLAIWIPACASPSPAFLMTYSAYELNKQGDNIQPFPIYSVPNLEPICCSISNSNCCFLTDLHTDFSGGRSGGLEFPSL